KPISGGCREPARVIGASLHRSWAHREGRLPLGQGGTAVFDALGVDGGRGAAHACSRPDRLLARHADAASRADQASGRAHKLIIPCPERRNGPGCSSNKLKRLENLPTTRYCCSQSSSAFGSQTTWPSMAT